MAFHNANGIWRSEKWKQVVSPCRNLLQFSSLKFALILVINCLNHDTFSLQWHHSGRNGISNHQPHDFLLDRLFRRRSKKTSKLCVIGLFAGNSPLTDDFPTQVASNAENVSIWRRHHDCLFDFTGWISDNITSIPELYNVSKMFKFNCFWSKSPLSLLWVWLISCHNHMLINKKIHALSACWFNCTP